ncbi:MAG: hypothetical protein D6711_05085, partial [Chloroflexi bacterium]
MDDLSWSGHDKNGKEVGAVVAFGKGGRVRSPACEGRRQRGALRICAWASTAYRAWYAAMKGKSCGAGA